MNRYDRQIQFAALGQEGQDKLASAHVSIIDQGALGTASSSFLARAGVGKITIVDDDTVELTNLQRQNLFEEADVGKSKALSAAEHISKINSEIKITAVCSRITDENIAEILGDTQLVIDAVDNIDARLCINRYCVKKGIPWIYAGVAGAEGMSMNILPGGPCFSCLMPISPGDSSRVANAVTLGIIPTLAANIAAIQCTEAIKILTLGASAPCVRKGLVYIDLYNNIFEQLEVTRLPGCAVCSGKDADYGNIIRKDS